MLGALGHVLAPGRRYWIHALWCLIMVPAPLGFWWAIWTYHEIDAWTFRAFASVMLTPALLYLTVIALVSDTPSSIQSWRAHFFSRRRLFFSLVLASMLSIYLRQLAVLGDAAAPLFDDKFQLQPFVTTMLVVIPLAGFFTTQERAHAVLCVCVAGITVFTYAGLFVG